MERQDPPAVTVTSTELLEGLRNPANEAVWQQYVDRYRPLIERAGVGYGLSRADAEEVAQRSLIDFAKAYGEGSYQRDRGRLRDWLFGIVRNRVRGDRRANARERARVAGDQTAGEDLLASAQASDELEALWEEEWRAEIMRQCTDLVRAEVQPRTYEAFRRYALESEPAEDVARSLEIDLEAVYDAKRRVLRRMRELQPVLEETF